MNCPKCGAKERHVNEWESDVDNEWACESSQEGESFDQSFECLESERDRLRQLVGLMLEYADGYLPCDIKKQVEAAITPNLARDLAGEEGN